MYVGSPTEATVEKSIASIAHNLGRGAELGCLGVVVHAGSAVGEDRYEDALRQLHERLLPVLDTLPDGGPRLLVEPTAGGGMSLAATVEDLGPYLAALDWHPAVGAGRLGLVHANDSLDECGSKRDRHTTLGEGSIGGGPYGVGPSPSSWFTRRWPASRSSSRRRASWTARPRPDTRGTSRSWCR